MQRNGDAGKPLWLTEQDWETDAIGESLQAQYLVDSLRIVKERDFVQAYFWFEFIDRAGSFGLVRRDLGARLSFKSYSSMD